jgi:hypothetical protein
VKIANTHTHYYQIQYTETGKFLFGIDQIPNKPGKWASRWESRSDYAWKWPCGKYGHFGRGGVKTWLKILLIRQPKLEGKVRIVRITPSNASEAFFRQKVDGAFPSAKE